MFGLVALCVVRGGMSCDVCGWFVCYWLCCVRVALMCAKIHFSCVWLLILLFGVDCGLGLRLVAWNVVCDFSSCFALCVAWMCVGIVTRRDCPIHCFEGVNAA